MTAAENKLRANWAWHALEAFAEVSGQRANGELEVDPAGVLSDLLCNLMHLVHQEQIEFDFADKIEPLIACFEDELDEEEEEENAKETNE